MVNKIKKNKLVTGLFTIALIIGIVIPVALQALTISNGKDYKVFREPDRNKSVITSVKKFPDGNYAYCLERMKIAPDDGTDIKPGSEVTDARIWKALKYGYPNQKWYNTGNTDKDEKLNYYVTQLAVWYYTEKWDMAKIDSFTQATTTPKYEAITTDIPTLKKHIKDLIAQIEADTSDITPQLSFSNNNIALKGKANEAKETELITLQGNNITGTAQIVLNNAPEGVYVANESGEKNNNVAIGGKFKIVIPANTPASTFTFSVSGKGETLKAINYDSSEKQDVVAYDEVEITLPTDAQGTVTWGPDETKSVINIAKVNSETGEPLPGAKFTLAQNGEVIYEVETDKFGMGTIKDVKAGTYQLQEVQAPDGFVIDPDIKEITITPEDNGRTIEITAPNAPIKGSVELIKKDEEDPTKTLEGVKFELYSLDGKAIEEQSPVEDNQDQESKTKEEGTTTSEEQSPTEDNTTEEQSPTEDNTTSEENQSQDSENLLKEPQEPLEDGSRLIGIYTTNAEGKIKVSNLNFGKYKFKEVEAKEGYVLDSTPIEFEITENEQVISLEKTNKKITGELEITKVDISTGKLLPDATFVIYDETGENVVVKGKTDENGIAKFKLDYGKYYYQELEAPDGYLIDDTKFPFEIKTDGEIVKCRMTNSKLPKTGTVPTSLGLIAPIGVVGIAGAVTLFRKR